MSFSRSTHICDQMAGVCLYTWGCNKTQKGDWAIIKSRIWKYG